MKALWSWLTRHLHRTPPPPPPATCHAYNEHVDDIVQRWKHKRIESERAERQWRKEQNFIEKAWKGSQDGK